MIKLNYTNVNVNKLHDELSKAEIKPNAVMTLQDGSCELQFHKIFKNELKDEDGNIVNTVYTEKIQVLIDEGLETEHIEDQYIDFDFDGLVAKIQGVVDAHDILSDKKQSLISSIGSIRREQLQTVFTYENHRQPYSLTYDRPMAQACKEMFSDDDFLSDSAQWLGEYIPTIHWSWTDYDGTKGVTKVTSADYFINMEKQWLIREQKARVLESIIESEINNLQLEEDLDSYDILTRFKELLGEI